MSRPLRIQYPNACYHVTCRGNGKQNIFLADYDRKKFLELLSRSLEIYDVRLFAFVLMTNHFHIVVKTPKANLQEFMRHFNISYTAYFNKRHQRSGHLYQGRYKSFLIDVDSYLLEVSRYVHLNSIRISRFSEIPLEEKKAALDAFPWSSYGDYISSSRHAFLSTDTILAYFNGNRTSYKEFVEEGISGCVNPLEKGKGHGIVGDPPFIKEMLKTMVIIPAREQPETKRIISRIAPPEIIDRVAHHFHSAPEEVLKKPGPARSIAMDFLFRFAGMNQREIGEVMSLDYSSVSVARTRLRERLKKDSTLQRAVKELEDAISQE